MAERAEGRGRAAILPFPSAGVPPGELLRRLLPSGRALVLGFGLLAGAVLAYVAARETSMFAIREVAVRGAGPAVATRVRTALKPLRGTSLVALDAAEVQQRLAALPEIAGATYDRAFPHTLRVVVRPERPIAIVRRGAEAWIVSAGARVMRPIPVETTLPLPRVWVARTADVEVGATLEDGDAVRAIRALALIRTLHVPATLRFVRASDRELTLVLQSGLEVRLGDARGLRLKIAVAARIVRDVVSATPRYAYLDLSVPERPVAGR